MVFYSATGPLKFELKEDNPDAWNIIQNFKDTSKMVEIYGCLDNNVGACGFPSWHVRAAVPLVGAMVIKPGQNAPPKEVPSSRCETCFNS
jgi:hypothetical protein